MTFSGMAYSPELANDYGTEKKTEKTADEKNNQGSVISANSGSFVQVHAPSLQPGLFVIHQISLPTEEGFVLDEIDFEETTSYYQNLFCSSICINAP